MPRAPKPRAYDWVAESDDERRGPQGRPRSGPRGLAVRQLPRLTVRAPARVLALFAAFCESRGLQTHAGFAALVEAGVKLDPNHRTKIERRAREIQRERFPDAP